MKSLMKEGRMFKLTWVLPFFVLLLNSCGTSKSTSEVKDPSGMEWVENSTLTDVIEEARAQEKLIFLDFYTDWCTPCKMMDRDVFADKDIHNFLNENFVNFKVNAERSNGPNLALMYGVQSYPTLIFVDYKGRVLSRKNGAAYHTELKKLANVAIALGRGL